MSSTLISRKQWSYSVQRLENVESVINNPNDRSRSENLVLSDVHAITFRPL